MANGVIKLSASRQCVAAILARLLFWLALLISMCISVMKSVLPSYKARRPPFDRHNSKQHVSQSIHYVFAIFQRLFFLVLGQLFELFKRGARFIASFQSSVGETELIVSLREIWI